MSPKEAKIELTKYRVDDVITASLALIQYFTRYSGVIGVEQWANSIGRLIDIIEGQKSDPYAFSAEGLELAFSGFPHPIPLIVGGKVVYRAREPRFVVLDHLAEVLPRQRTKIARATASIAGEMEDLYRMKIDVHPWTFIFPKERYAVEWVVFDAAIL